MTGREECALMKALRKEIAEANGIIYLSSECDFVGDCPGHCPKCDAEAKHLDDELNRIAKEGQAITLPSTVYKEIMLSIKEIAYPYVEDAAHLKAKKLYANLRPTDEDRASEILYEHNALDEAIIPLDTIDIPIF